MLQRRFELRLFIALRAKSLLILFLSARRQGGNRRYRICVRSSMPCKRQKKRRSVDRLFSGAPAEIRTPDTLLKRQVLCLLSYWGIRGISPRTSTVFYQLSPNCSTKNMKQVQHWCNILQPISAYSSRSDL